MRLLFAKQNLLFYLYEAQELGLKNTQVAHKFILINFI